MITRLAAVVLTCLATPVMASSYTPHTLTVADRAVIEAGVRSRLKDPDSAKFRGLVAGMPPDKSGIFVCGWVNAKNSFGGYTGDRPFGGVFLNPKTYAVIGLGETSAQITAVLQVCDKHGLRPR